MAIEKILPDLEPLCVPIDRVESYNRNPRKGDVNAIKASIRELGLHKPIVVQKTGQTPDGEPTGIVLAGNHMLAACRALKWKRIPVVWTEDSEAVQRARLIADNSSAEKGAGWDDDLLAEMLSYIADDPELLAATSFTTADIDKLLGEDGVDEGDAEVEDPNPVWGVIIECEDEAEQDTILNEQIEAGRKCRAIL